MQLANQQIATGTRFRILVPDTRDTPIVLTNFWGKSAGKWLFGKIVFNLDLHKVILLDRVVVS